MELPEQSADCAFRKTYRLIRILPVFFFCCFFLFFIPLSGCRAKSYELPRWLEGSWKTSFNDVVICETWEIKKGYMAGSTIWSIDGKHRQETLRICYSNDTLVYFIRLEDKRELKFVCQDAENDTLIFVNNKNDFPKRLVYVRPKGNKMNAWIDNEEKDPNRISFPFEKIDAQ